jgi:hypothetical protein
MIVLNSAPIIERLQRTKRLLRGRQVSSKSSQGQVIKTIVIDTFNDINSRMSDTI